MGDIVQFRQKGEEIPYLVLSEEITTLLSRAIELGLISKFFVTDIADNREAYKLYKIIIELPNGKKAQFEQPGYEVINFLNGLCLGAYLMEQRYVVKF